MFYYTDSNTVEILAPLLLVLSLLVLHQVTDNSTVLILEPLYYCIVLIILVLFQCTDASSVSVLVLLCSLLI